MSADAPSESDSFDATAEIAFPTQEAGETLVRTLRDHPRFCSWCLLPLGVNPTVRFTPEGPEAPLKTSETYHEFGGPERDVPPDRTDEQGRVVELSRDEKRICRDCGVIDVDVSESRTKETTQIALRHVTSILDENGVDVSRPVADETVTEAFRKGHTGKFVGTLGRAVYKATG